MLQYRQQQEADRRMADERLAAERARTEGQRTTGMQLAAQDAQRADEALDRMAKEIETSFAEAFGVELITAVQAERKEGNTNG